MERNEKNEKTKTVDINHFCVLWGEATGFEMFLKEAKSLAKQVMFDLVVVDEAHRQVLTSTHAHDIVRCSKVLCFQGGLCSIGIFS
jgi:type I site-specific restriction endonuclease